MTKMINGADDEQKYTNRKQIDQIPAKMGTPMTMESQTGRSS